MTSSEKEQLRRRVLKLPQDNLRRATEIIGQREGSETESHHVMFADPEKAVKCRYMNTYKATKRVSPYCCLLHGHLAGQ